jgi:DNA-binding NarL/FixJ family response regulator
MPYDSGERAVATPVRIILVDDHAVVREGVRALLDEETGLEVVGEFSDGAQALEAAAALSPDVAIVDLRMPGLSAVETIRGLRRICPDANVLVFTSFGEDAAIRATLDAGAIGYLLKDALRGELVRALRTVANGEPYLDPAAQRQLVSMLKRQPTADEPLTARELSVLKLIAEGLANKQIARKLNLTEGTVKGYVSQILDKLHVTDRTQAALHAVRRGLVDAEG